MTPISIHELVPMRDRRADLLQEIVGDYRRSPRLALTDAQVSRLYALEQETCNQLLACLVEEGFLQKRRDGRFVLGELSAS
jgi:hypothetical protein